MTTLQRILAEAGTVVLDVGLATELERMGADLRHALWSARLLDDAPELITQAHHRYFQAAARVAITASYQASPQGLEKHGYAAPYTKQLQRAIAYYRVSAPHSRSH